MGRVATGGVEALDARAGRWLHVRPKAASSRARTWSPGEDASARIATNPRGFYLRTLFTRAPPPRSERRPVRVPPCLAPAARLRLCRAPMIRTKVDAELEAAAEEHEGDPERADLIHRARRFKTSWLELAEALTEVRRSAHWKRWGFDSFEAYARSELHLKPETVEKLTGSFQFLRSKAPEVLRRDGLSAPIPSYQSVDFLRRAEESEPAESGVMEALRKRVIEDAAPAASVSREFKAQVFPIDDAAKKERDAAALRNVAKRLQDLLGETRAVPRRLALETAESIGKLLEALSKGEEKAA